MDEPETFHNLPQVASNSQPQIVDLSCHELWVHNIQLQEAVNKYMEENNKLNQQINNMEDFIKDANKTTADDMKKYLEAIELLDEDFKNTCEALDRAHEKLEDDLEDMKMLISMSEAKEAENSQLKENEKILRRKLKLLQSELRDLDDTIESEEEKKSNVFFFWKNGQNSKLEESQKKIKKLHQTLQDAYSEKIESQRKLATLSLQLKKSRDFINKQRKVILKLELDVKERSRCRDRNGIETLESVKKKRGTELTNFQKDEIAKLEDRIANLREEKSNLEKIVNCLREERKSEAEHLQLVKFKIDTQGSHQVELHNLREEIEMLKMKNQQLKSKITEQGEYQRKRDAELVTPSENEIGLLQIRNEDLQNSYFYKVEENITLNKTITELQLTVNSLVGEKEEIRHKMLEELKKERTQQQENNSASESEEIINNLTVENRQLENTIKVFKSEKLNFGSIFETFSQELFQLQGMLNRYTWGIPEIETTCGKTEPDAASMQTEIDVVSIIDSEYTTTTLGTTGINLDSICDDDAQRRIRSISSAIGSSSFAAGDPSGSFDSRSLNPKERTDKLKVYPAKFDKIRSRKNRKQKGRVATLDRDIVLEPENVHRLQNLIENLKDQIEKITTSVDVMEFEKDDLELEVNRLKASDTQYYNTNIKLLEENRRIKQELNDVRCKNKDLATQRQNLEETVMQLRRALTEAQTAFKLQLADCHMQNKEINDLKEMNTCLNNRITASEKANDEQTKLKIFNNVQQEWKCAHDELGIAGPRIRVADVVSLLERSQMFSKARQLSPRDRKTKRRTPLVTCSETTRIETEQLPNGWRNTWANGEAI